VLFHSEDDPVTLGDAERVSDFFGDGDLALRCDLGCDLDLSTAGLDKPQRDDTLRELAEAPP
jgi:hypothetical protein